VAWPFADVAFVDIAPCLELIEARPEGVLALLDDECLLPRGSDGGFLEKLAAKGGASPALLLAKRSDGTFGVRHYAADVTCRWR
jgi:myosin heavy subunit